MGFFRCTNIRYFGDPVEVIRYKPTDYNTQLKRLVSLDLKENPQSIDTVDDDKSKGAGENKQTLGFDLMSFTSRRGHFVDKVSLAQHLALEITQPMCFFEGQIGIKG